METRKKQYGAIKKKYQRKQVHRKGFETSKHTYERQMKDFLQMEKRTATSGNVVLYFK